MDWLLLHPTRFVSDWRAWLRDETRIKQIKFGARRMAAGRAERMSLSINSKRCSSQKKKKMEAEEAGLFK